MKDDRDTQTQDLKLDGQPIMEFDEKAPWPMPTVKPVEAQSTLNLAIREWIERLVKA